MHVCFWQATSHAKSQVLIYLSMAVGPLFKQEQTAKKLSKDILAEHPHFFPLKVNP